MTDLSEKLLSDLVHAVKDVVRKEASQRIRDVYLVGDIDKDSAKATIERMRELASDGDRPITLYLNTAGGNVTDGLAIHDAIAALVHRGVEMIVVVQGMARLKQMQDQIYKILADRSGRPLRQIIRDTKRTDFYLDAEKARSYGLIDDILKG